MPGASQELRRRIQAIAYGQAGYFRAAQARDVGYSYQAQKYHVDHGNWVRIDRGLFRLPDWPTEPTDAFVRWTLWSGDRGVVSHESALALHDLSDANPSRIHLSVPAAFRAEDPAVIVHRVDLDEADIDRRRGFSVTRIDRTLLDAAASDLSQELIDAAVADAIDRHLTTVGRLRRRAADASDRAALGIERALRAHVERA